MKRAISSIALASVVATLLTDPVEARRERRSYLSISGGVGGLTGEVGGDVLRDRASGRIDLGVGFQVAKPLLLEFTYGWSGTWDSEFAIGPLDPAEGFPSDAERAFKVGTNPIMLRARYARSGVRTEYIKPELSLGVGWVQVTRLLRNVPFVPPEETSQMLASVEFGLSALFVWTRDFTTSAGLRYTLTERRGVVDETGSLDSVALVLAFRAFLPSPRDP